MAKISELGNITGSNTKSRDLFVTVSIDQGEDGTKNITRAELVNAIELEVFDNIKISGGDYIRNIPLTNVTVNTSTISNSVMNSSTVNNSTIEDSQLNNPNITVSTDFVPRIDSDDYFYLKDVSTDTTVAIAYSQLYDEISNTAKKSNKVYVGVDGNDDFPGSYLKPVLTLEKAIAMATDAAAKGVPTAISVLPGDHYTNGNLALPDLCSMVSTNGQYATKIIMNSGYEVENCILVGSGCYVQGFSFFNLKVDNFDYPSKGFAISFRPGARIIRSPYIRDCSQISNYFAREIPPLLKPTNSKNTIDDLGFEVELSSVSGPFEVGDTIKADNGAKGIISRVAEIGTGVIYIRNVIGVLEENSNVTTASGGTATITTVGEEDFPNKEVGRGGGMILADRSLVDQDSIFPYILCFGATPRTQNGIGYVAKNGAGINGISSLSIFARCSFYALDGGQITLNNSGTQFGDISMRSKGFTPVFNPRETTATIVQNTLLGNELVDRSEEIIDDLWNYLEVDLGFQAYDSEKCKRDVGYILDGVGYDLVLGTNYWSIVNGIAYRRAESSVVIDEQLVETSGAISFLKSSVAALLTDTLSVARTNASFDEIIDILNNGDVSANTVTFSSTGNVNYDNARSLIQENKAFIQSELISWINSNYPDLDYDENTCERDAGYIIDGFSHDINYNSNIATILNAEAYFLGTASLLPVDQRIPTAAAIERLGIICSSIVLGTYPGQTTGTAATISESNRCITLSGIIRNVIRQNSLGALPARKEPSLLWVDIDFDNSRDVIIKNKTSLQKATLAFVNAEYNFLDENLTRRDAANLITSFSNDFKFGRQTASRIFTAGLFNYEGKHVFSVFNPDVPGLNYIGSVDAIPTETNKNIRDAYIVYNPLSEPLNKYEGAVYFWNGTVWVNTGPNNTSLLNAFINSWERMKTYIITNIISVGYTSAESDMLSGLVDDVLITSVKNPRILNFGSLVESLSHQFNLASAGVNVNALPLNFRRLGQPISAAASVLQEEGGRVRWSGADELNNQYFARGLKINGRTGRLEGRPFTSSVRKLARRASNSRAII